MVVTFMGRSIDLHTQCSEAEAGLRLPYVVRREVDGGTVEFKCLYGIGDDRSFEAAHELIFVGSTDSPTSIEEIQYVGIDVGEPGEEDFFLSRLAFATGQQPFADLSALARRLRNLRRGVGFSQDGMRITGLREGGTYKFLVKPESPGR